jgi:hypothetical protein
LPTAGLECLLELILSGLPREVERGIEFPFFIVGCKDIACTIFFTLFLGKVLKKHDLNNIWNVI